MNTVPQSSTELKLIDWNPAGGYESSGEGGLFAYAVWSLAEVFSSFSGPVLNSFPKLISEDVLTGVRGADAEHFGNADIQLAKLRRNSRGDSLELDEYRYAPQTPVVIFLGGTDASLYSESYGEYFAVGEDNLTPAGEALIGALEAVYGPATYLTFLDT